MFEKMLHKINDLNPLRKSKHPFKNFINSMKVNVNRINELHNHQLLDANLNDTLEHKISNLKNNLIQLYPQLKEIEESVSLNNFYQKLLTFLETQKTDREMDFKLLISYTFDQIKLAIEYNNNNDIDDLLCSILTQTIMDLKNNKGFSRMRDNILNKTSEYISKKKFNIYLKKLIENHLPILLGQNRLRAKPKNNAENNVHTETGFNFHIMYLKDVTYTVTGVMPSAQEVIDLTYNSAIQKALQELSNHHYLNFLKTITGIIRIISADAKADEQSETKPHDILVKLLLANGISKHLIQLNEIHCSLLSRFKNDEDLFSKSSLQIFIEATRKALQLPNINSDSANDNYDKLPELAKLSPAQCAELAPTPLNIVTLTVLRFLGEGSCNHAYLVEFELNGKKAQYVLRRPIAIYISDEDNVKRKEREFTGHPSLLKIFNTSSEKIKIINAGSEKIAAKNVNIRYEHIQLAQGSLKDLPKLDRTAKKTSSILKQIIEADYFLYSLGRAHGDIKPSNIFIIEHKENEIQVALADFDDAKNLAIDVHEVYGSIGYIPPERQIGKIPVPGVTRAGDPWAIGVTAFQFAMQTSPDENLVDSPVDKDGNFIGFDHDDFKKEEAKFFRRDENGFVNPFAKELAEVIEKLLAPDVNKRIENYETILSMDFFKEELFKNQEDYGQQDSKGKEASQENSEQEMPISVVSNFRGEAIKTPVLNWNDLKTTLKNIKTTPDFSKTKATFLDYERLKKLINQLHQQKNEEEGPAQEKILKEMLQIFNEPHPGSLINELLAFIALRHQIISHLNEIDLRRQLLSDYPEESVGEKTTQSISKSFDGPRKVLAFKRHCANFFSSSLSTIGPALIGNNGYVELLDEDKTNELAL